MYRLLKYCTIYTKYNYSVKYYQGQPAPQRQPELLVGSAPSTRTPIPSSPLAAMSDGHRSLQPPPRHLRLHQSPRHPRPEPGLGGGFRLRPPRRPVPLEESLHLLPNTCLRPLVRGDPASGVVVGDIYGPAGSNDGRIRADYVYNTAADRLLPRGAGRASDWLELLAQQAAQADTPLEHSSQARRIHGRGAMPPRELGTENPLAKYSWRHKEQAPLSPRMERDAVFPYHAPSIGCRSPRLRSPRIVAPVAMLRTVQAQPDVGILDLETPAFIREIDAAHEAFVSGGSLSSGLTMRVMNQLLPNTLSHARR